MNLHERHIADSASKAGHGTDHLGIEEQSTKDTGASDALVLMRCRQDAVLHAGNREAVAAPTHVVKRVEEVSLRITGFLTGAGCLNLLLEHLDLGLLRPS